VDFWPHAQAERTSLVKGGVMSQIHCNACGQLFESYRGKKYCSPECRGSARAPAVYRFISPDGRSYVGSVKDCRKRGDEGIRRTNSRLLAAFEKYPPETFIYEVLERLPRRCPKWELRAAEQRHIDRLRSWAPEAGFNVDPAVWEGDGPAHRAARQFRAEVIAGVHERASRRTAEWRRDREAATK
jgi:hypothetical protein